jgi:D-sedoheptulose 7-phosphate isomerase
MNVTNSYIDGLKQTLDQLPLDLVEEAIQVVHQARIHQKQIFIMGNGGSASTASHFVCDLSKNTKQAGWPNFRVIGLTDNNALFSAIANDEGYENVFAHQLASFVRPGDVVIAISASGNSANVLRAVELAREAQATTIGFSGFNGGQLGRMVDLHIHVPSDQIEHVEDIHLMLEHMMTKALREMSQVLEPQTIQDLDFPQLVEHIEMSLDYSGEMPVVAPNLEGKRNQRDVLSMVQGILKQLEGLPDVKGFLQRLLMLTLNGVGAASGSIVVLDDEGKAIEGALAYGGNVRIYPAPKFDDVVARGLVGWVAQHRQSALILDTKQDPRWLTRSWETLKEQSRSAISVPLTDRDEVVGVVTLVSSDEKPFTQEDIALLTAIAVTVSLNKTKTFAFRRVQQATEV